MVHSKSNSELMVAAAFRCASRKSWNEVSLSDIANEAGLTLHELHGLAASRDEILDIYANNVDSSVLADFEYDPNDSVRDRLFELLLGRFDELEANRDALKSITNAGMLDPVVLIGGAQRLSKSMRWTLEVAGVPVLGIKGALQVKFLSGIYLKALRVWFTDETDDFSITMKSVDSSLEKAEKWAGFVNDKYSSLYSGKARANSSSKSENGSNVSEDEIILET
jgi:ubiquinone biosynthesis protein COQ9